MNQPLLDKRGRKIHPRSQLARRRNMFLGRFRQAEGTVRQLAADVAGEYRDAKQSPAQTQGVWDQNKEIGWKIAALERMAAGILTDLASLRKDCENFYQEVHNIKTPQPATLKKEQPE